MSSPSASAFLLEEASSLELTFPLTPLVLGTVLAMDLWPVDLEVLPWPSRRYRWKVVQVALAPSVSHLSSELEVPLQLVPVRRHSLDCLLHFRLYPPLAKQKTEPKVVA